jgi:NAD-dependent SIR2 family protein deacetylase
MLNFILGLILGIFLGASLIITLLLYLLKIKCPKCKQQKPLKEIIFFRWKELTITGQACLKCQAVKPQVDIY